MHNCLLSIAFKTGAVVNALTRAPGEVFTMEDIKAVWLCTVFKSYVGMLLSCK